MPERLGLSRGGNGFMRYRSKLRHTLFMYKYNVCHRSHKHTLLNLVHCSVKKKVEAVQHLKRILKYSDFEERAHTVSVLMDEMKNVIQQDVCVESQS